MALKLHTRIVGEVVVVCCDGRIVFGDEGAVLRERVGSMLTGTPRIVLDLHGVDHVGQRGTGHPGRACNLGEEPGGASSS